MRWLAFIAIAFAFFLLAGPAGAAEREDPGDNFSHSVVLELFVTTWCQYCPDGEREAARLNFEYKDNFHFMSMVTDENDEADSRSDEYSVVSVPTAIFDGDYREDRSGDAGSYEGHIEASGDRNVAPIELTVTLEDEGDGNVRVGYSATYTGTTWPWQDVDLKVAIVEKVSRYVNLENESIPYGFIHYAFDKDLRLISQTEQSESTTWDASECDFSNLLVIGVVYDSTTTGWALQAASTEQYANLMIGNVTWEPEKPTSDDRVTVSVPVEGDVGNVIVEVAACTETSCLKEEEINMTLEGGVYTADIGKFKDGYIIHVKIVAEDTEGGISESIQYEFHIGEGGDDDSDSLPGFEALTMTVALLGAILISRRSR